MTEKQFKEIFPGEEQSTITVVGKNHSRHYLHCDMGAQCCPVVQRPPSADDDSHMVNELGRCSEVPVPDADSSSQLPDYIPNWQIFIDQLETVDKMVAQWQNPTTIWTGQPVLGFMAETDFDDLRTVGLKDFNPMLWFPSTSVSQSWDYIAFGMEASHLKENPGHEKDALVSQSPIVVFKASTVLQSLGILASRIVLPSSDVKGEKKNPTCCPSTWNYAYIYDTPATYSDLLRREGAHSFLSHECILSVIVQMSNKNAAHPQCAFADSESSVLSGLLGGVWAGGVRLI